MTNRPPDPMTRTLDAVIRTLLVLLTLVLSALQLSAQEAASPFFFIERIEVRNAKRVSPDVVIAESRLDAGREYTEAELRDASTRLSRLPYLLGVDFSLEKGSERGHHVLVLTINETKPFFYSLDAVPFFEDEYVEIDFSGRLDRRDNEGVLGFRWFVGRRGAVHLGLTSSHTIQSAPRADCRSCDYGGWNLNFDQGSLSAGYTQYDLFGTGAFASLNLRRPITGFEYGGITPELVVGMPLSPNQTVTLHLEETRFDRKEQWVDGELRSSVQAGRRMLSARWSYNTTNNPFVPTRGTIFAVTPIVAWQDSANFIDTFDFERQERVQSSWIHHSTLTSLEAEAEHFWELSDRNSISAGAVGGWSRAEIRETPSLPGAGTDFEGRFGVLRTGFTHSFWDSSRRGRGDSLLELDLRFSNRSNDQTFIAYPRPSRDARQFSAAWVRRSSWGTLRLGAGYAW